MRLLNGRPLLEYSILAARQSNVFTTTIVASDDDDVVGVAMLAGADAVKRRNVKDSQPDIQWIREVLSHLRGKNRPDAFAILRPTSPFRTARTIQRAYGVFRDMGECGDSIRAVEPVRQHPGKMWTWPGPGYPIKPLLGDKRHSDGTPWHSSPTQTLPPIFVQNSSLEMSWTSNVEVHGTIHGRKVVPFFTEGHEGFSIDYPEDFEHAERLVHQHPELLPPIVHV